MSDNAVPTFLHGTDPIQLLHWRAEDVNYPMRDPAFHRPYSAHNPCVYMTLPADQIPPERVRRPREFASKLGLSPRLNSLRIPDSSLKIIGPPAISAVESFPFFLAPLASSCHCPRPDPSRGARCVRSATQTHDSAWHVFACFFSAPPWRPPSSLHRNSDSPATGALELSISLAQVLASIPVRSMRRYPQAPHKFLDTLLLTS
jgi:hypothetical protein